MTGPRPSFPLADAVAVIDEQSCIGCTLCIQACPVDAIVGATGVMHTVIAQECTGCQLCLAPCPVDCISMLATGGQLTLEQKRAAVTLAQQRFDSRKRRLQLEQEERALRRAASRESAAERNKRETIQKAMARAKARLQQRR